MPDPSRSSLSARARVLQVDGSLFDVTGGIIIHVSFNCFDLSFTLKNEGFKKVLDRDALEKTCFAPQRTIHSKVL